MTPPTIRGFHHVTAIASHPRDWTRFYTDILGLRMVKRTVNFDDTSTLHLYAADEHGSTGSILTAFPYPRAHASSPGRPMIERTTLAIPAGSLDDWRDRLTHAGVDVNDDQSFGTPRLIFADHDGQGLALVERAEFDDADRVGPIVSAAFRVGRAESTIALLTDLFGFDNTATEGDTSRLTLTRADRGTLIDVVSDAGSPPASSGAGFVHHIALAVDDEDALRAFQRVLEDRGLPTSGVKDRTYFKSLYVREPGGIIIELATNGPGFHADEPADTMGQALILPDYADKGVRDKLEALLAE
jgi:glyoxalase family protein